MRGECIPTLDGPRDYLTGLDPRATTQFFVFPGDGWWRSCRSVCKIKRGYEERTAQQLISKHKI
jgi:hypothetical protein